MALVGSRVELDADEVRGQAEGAGPGAGGVGGMRRPAGSQAGREGGQAALHAGERPAGPGSAARSRPEPSWTFWVFCRAVLNPTVVFRGSSAGCPPGGRRRAA